MEKAEEEKQIWGGKKAHTHKTQSTKKSNKIAGLFTIAKDESSPSVLKRGPDYLILKVWAPGGLSQLSV